MHNNKLPFLEIEVVYADTEQCHIISVKVEAGSTIERAITESRICELCAGVQINQVGIFGELKTLDTLVSAGDRIEIYRPLLQSAMVSRRAKVLKKSPQRKKARQRPVRDLG